MKTKNELLKELAESIAAYEFENHHEPVTVEIAKLIYTWARMPRRQHVVLRIQGTDKDNDNK